MLSVEQKKTAEFYLTGMWDMRERLRTGELTAVESKLRPGFEGDPKRFSKMISRITSSFDATSGCLRFDRQIDYTPVNPELSIPYRYVVNDNYSCFYRGDSDSVQKQNPDHDFRDGEAAPWDVRVLGLNNWAEHRGVHSLAKRRKFYELLGEPSDVKEDGGVCLVTWTFGDRKEMRLRLTIDRKQGFAATRMEDLLHTPTGWNSMTVVEVAWLEKSGVWLPKRVDFINPRAGLGDPREAASKHFIDIQWKSVNRPVKAERFRYEGMELPAGTRVWEMRLSPGVLEKIIGDEAKPSATAPIGRGRFWWFVAMGAAVPVVLWGAVWIVRRRRQTSYQVA